jgi:hypothetical protein
VLRPCIDAPTWANVAHLRLDALNLKLNLWTASENQADNARRRGVFDRFKSDS